MTVHPPNRHERPAARASPATPLAIALGITTIFLIIEVIGGLLTNSLALLADAGHMLTDVIALGLSLFTVWLARKPPTPDLSFGYHRAEILAALFNAAMLIAISFYIFWEAVQRIGEPPAVNSRLMLGIGVAGLVANALSAWMLSRGDAHQQNLNARGAFLHVIGDTLGSIGAIVAATIMLTTGLFIADPILSILIGLFILRSAWRLLSDSVLVLMEATPPQIEPVALREAILSVDGIAGVHDVHVRTVTSDLIAMSGHVELYGEREWEAILEEVCLLLRERFGIVHVTLQPEATGDRSGSVPDRRASPQP